MTQKQFSPTKKKLAPAVKKMTFPEAMKEIIAGKRVARVIWPTDEFGLIKDGFLMVYKNSQFYRWILNDGDLFGQDWKIHEGE